MKVFLPLNIRVDDKKILFVGGGKIALHKIRTIEQYTRNITIVAPEIIGELKGRGFTEVVKRYEPSDLDGFFLVYASTNDNDVNRRVKADASALGIMVNVVDNRELSDFISPAIIKKGEMTVAVSSNGSNVKRSVEWRNRLRDTVINQWSEADDQRMKAHREALAKGYVYIAGAGPGDPDLLTMKAHRVLQEADVILYDDLVSPELVEQYPAEKVYTGKRKDSHHLEQEEINREIVRQALMGKRVVRLKGGDPFIFGRGGEEIDTLRREGIGYEIIPGITAAHGASAYTEIPLTMRKVSSSVAFCTGHPVSRIQVPDTDTIVYYMVASTVHDVLDKVAAGGRSGDTKVAVVQNATCYNQKTFTGTLDEFRRRERAVYSPALVIIGDNIAQFVENCWYSRKKKVLMTGGDSRRYSWSDCVVVNFTCRRTAGDAPREGAVDLEFIDEIYFSSPDCVRNFRSLYASIPDRIAVTPADDRTAEELAKQFGR